MKTYRYVRRGGLPKHLQGLWLDTLWLMGQTYRRRVRRILDARQRRV